MFKYIQYTVRVYCILRTRNKCHLADGVASLGANKNRENWPMEAVPRLNVNSLIGMPRSSRVGGGG